MQTLSKHEVVILKIFCKPICDNFSWRWYGVILLRKLLADLWMTIFSSDNIFILFFAFYNEYFLLFVYRLYLVPAPDVWQFSDLFVSHVKEYLEPLTPTFARELFSQLWFHMKLPNNSRTKCGVKGSRNLLTWLMSRFENFQTSGACIRRNLRKNQLHCKRFNRLYQL